MKRIKLLPASMLALLILAGTSCKNTNNDDDNNLPDADFTVEISKAEAISNEIGTTVDFAFEDDKMKGSTGGFPYSNCATLTFDLTSTPKKLTIDFGETNCLCYDNRYRRGKIFVEYTGEYTQEGSFRQVTSENFYINDNEVIINKTITTEGYNASNHLVFSINETGTIHWVDETTYTWASERQREWIEGEGTLNITDDVYLITGNASGSNSNGDSFTKVVTSALKYKISCTNIVSGVVSITMNNALNILVNFGEGECDRIAIVTILGYTFEIILW